ncbi:hypothetical protein C8A05DRAFT_37064 [Staphylotrichum tortipilum]|uniref:Uncharacterized protein n=1 Tax=Staphylotrichum tortipilum TaxID=2831512 RepID=A0AAN6RQR0_9PEZI|nr:hypothetical protein C8A05DRAFT_37064 [Staphylotrichum longicolle]
MSSFKHSYVNFRNKGEVKASLIFAAYGELRIPYTEEVLPGIAPIGARGIVTIGPKFKLVASFEGKVSIKAIPMMTFVVVFDPKWAVTGAAVNLAIDTYLRIHSHAAVGSQQDIEYCIGAEAGYNTFAQITAP